MFRGTTAVAMGLLTAEQLRSPPWRPLFRGVYAHVELPVTHELRARAAAMYVVPGAVVTGVSAASLWDVDLVGAAEDVELTVPRGTHPRRVPGVRVRRAALLPDDVQRRRDVLATTPLATTVRLAGCLPLDDAVDAVDRMVHAGLTDLDDVRRLAGAARGPGSARARAACDLADGLAGSPQETRLRLLLLRSGLPTPVAQFTVRHEGRFVADVDLAWPEHRLALEYDGLWHGDPDQFGKDRRRLNRITAAGWRVVFATAADLHRPAALLGRLRAELSVGVQLPG